MQARFAVVLAVGASALIAVVSLWPQRAKACGGCFSPQEQVARVESHRMVIRPGIEGTTLWDQIIYSGNPEDFVWVLPVPNENVVIDIADPSFFDFIEDGTRAVVQPANPVQFCGGGSSPSFGCAGSTALSDGAADNADDGVEIFDQRVVGPYETVVLGSEDPAALSLWLNDNGYNVTDESLPAIEHYVGEGSAFVVLRLAPGEDVNSMQPVRVSYEGFMGRFPLKMVTVGASGVLDLSLWVIAEQRYDVANYGTVELDENELAWDFNTNTSNYQDLFNATAEANGNRAWIAEYAGPFDELAFRAFNGTPFDAADDIEVAREGNQTPFITKLRARVLVEHIDEDLVLAPAENPEPISGVFLAGKDVNRPDDPDCSSDDDGVACQSGSTHRASGTMLLLLLALFLVRRRLPGLGRRAQR